MLFGRLKCITYTEIKICLNPLLQHNIAITNIIYPKNSINNQ